MSGLKLSYSAVRRCSSSIGSSPIAIRRVSAIFASIAASMGPLASKNLALSEFLSGGVSIFFNAGENLIAASAHEHGGPAATVRRAYPWRRAHQAERVNAFTGACKTWPVTTLRRGGARMSGLPGASLTFSLERPKVQVGVFDAFGLFNRDDGVVSLRGWCAGHDRVGQVVGGSGTLEGRPADFAPQKMRSRGLQLRR